MGCCDEARWSVMLKDDKFVPSYDPSRTVGIVGGLTEYCEGIGVGRLQDLVGVAHGVGSNGPRVEMMEVGIGGGRTLEVCHPGVAPEGVESLFGQVVEHDQYHTVGNIGPGDVVIDVGASIGAWTWLAATCGAQVFAVEPNPQEVPSLLGLVRHHGLAAVTVSQLALGDEAGVIRFCPGKVSSLAKGQILTDDNPSRSLPRATAESLAITVSMVTLDDYAFGWGLDRVDVIKVDTEGCERRVLLGAAETIRRLRPVLLMSEYHRPEDAVGLPALVHSIAEGYAEHHVRREHPLCEPIIAMVPAEREWKF